MPPRQGKPEQVKSLEATLWEAADRLRSRVDAAEYKHVVLGLIFLKYVSDVFAKRREELRRLVDDPDSDYFMPNDDARASVLEDRDQYTAENVFWVPLEARWKTINRTPAKQPDVGKRVDRAMEAIEARENPTLKGVLPKDYARPAMRPGSGNSSTSSGPSNSSPATRPELFGWPRSHLLKDILGRRLRIFPRQVRHGRGEVGGRVLHACVRGPRCSSICSNRTRAGLRPVLWLGRDVRAVGEVRRGPRRAARRSIDLRPGVEPDDLAAGQDEPGIRGIEANLGAAPADSFHNDLHKDLRADFILANPPFNVSDWGGERLRDDPRWKFGTPPVGNANYAWVQHIAPPPGPERGRRVPVLANGSMSSQPVRRRRDLPGAGRGRPGRLHDRTAAAIVLHAQIPACLWFLTKDKSGKARRSGPGVSPRRPRFGETLFIDASTLGHMVSRTNRELSAVDIARIVDTYHAWRGEDGDIKSYENIPGFCASVALDTIREHQYILTPGRYVGSEAVADDGEPLDVKIARLTTEIREGFAKRAELQAKVLTGLCPSPPSRVGGG